MVNAVCDILGDADSGDFPYKPYIWIDLTKQTAGAADS